MSLQKPTLFSMPESSKIIQSLRSDRLADTLDLAINRTFQDQHPQDNYWWYALEANDTINSEMIFLIHWLGLNQPERIKSLARWILQKQNTNGSWSLYYGDSGCLSTTVECYIALKMAGFSQDDAALIRARNFILENGGITKVRIFSRIHFALLGLTDWSICPQMPVAFIQMPPNALINIYEFSSWARACIVPLLVILDKKPVYRVNFNVDELYVNKITDRWTYSKKPMFSVENLFLKIDKILQVLDKLKIKPLRKSSLKKCEAYIREHLPLTEDIFPAMCYGTLALHALGFDHTDPVFARGLEGLTHFQMGANHQQQTDLHRLPYETALRENFLPHSSKRTFVTGDYFASLNPTLLDDVSLQQSEDKSSKTNRIPQSVYQQCCISPVWDTAWAGTALLDAGVDRNHPLLLKAARWLLERQTKDIKGDWKIKNPNAEPGGWAFEFENKYYPDIDDSIQVLEFLHGVALPFPELKPAFDRGMQWVLSMQSDNGGFAAFDKNNNLQLVNKIPFSDHGACLDPATADITGRLIELVVKTEHLSKESFTIQRAADFILKQQSPDGSFWGRWGVNYIYGTWCVLGGLCALGRPKDLPVIRKAIQWLKSIQNPDGGFGESCHSYVVKRYVSLDKSIASQTAWALMTLVSAGEAASIEAQKAADWLIRNQNEDGTWDEMHHTGTGFPGHFYIRYHGYRHFFPLMALGKWRKAT